MMIKVVIPSAGGYEKLQIQEFPDLDPGDQEIVIDVKAVGINFADVCVRLGVYESAKKYVGWPITPGFEVSGVVKKTGPGANKFKVGDEVVGFTRFDAYASELKIAQSQALAVPDGFSLEEAAGFPAVFFTAYHAIFQQVYIPPKSKILVHSAAGGVGTALTQMLGALGHEVVGVVGSSHKVEYLNQFGPAKIIDKSTQNLWQEAKKFSPEGYQVIFDANGFSTLQDSYQHLRPTGKLIVYGSHDLLPKKGGRLNYIKAGIGLLKTPKFSPFDLITDNKSVIGFNVSFLFDEADSIRECIEGVTKLLKDHKLKPIPASFIKFEEVAEAHKLIESGQSVGKIILKL